MSAAQESSNGGNLSHREIQVIFFGLMAGMLVAALDQTVVSTALPTIVGDLGGLEHLSWVVTAYLLSSTISVPVYGKVSDLLGRKVVFQFALALFVGGSMLCGVAQNMAQLIGFRALQGLGGGGLLAMAQAIIGDVVSPRERGRYQGYLGAVFAFSSVVGPLIGGFFVDHLSWRWVFYVNVPVGAVAFAIIGAVLNLPFRKVQHRIDYLGGVLNNLPYVLTVETMAGIEVPERAQVMRVMMGHLGFNIIALNSPIEALNEFKKDPNAFDLVITDEVDPNLELSSRNLPHVEVVSVSHADPVSLIRFANVLLTKNAVAKFEELLK